MSKNPTISVCMIAKNEEKNLPRLLSSIRGLADEIVVVDTGSEDRTVEIAREYGAKVACFPWCDDFSAARNESLKHATKDYILWLDGDDEVRKDQHEKIRKDLRKHKDAGLFLRLRNVHGESGSESLQLRIFPNHRGVVFEGRVHEQAIYSVQRKNILTFASEAQVLHYGYDTPESVNAKLKRNRAILELEIAEDPDNINTLFFMSKSLRGLGENEAALACLNRLMDFAKANPDLYEKDILKLGVIDLATLLYSLGREEETLSVLEFSKTIYPGSVLVHFTLGELYFRHREYEKAFRELAPLEYETFEHELTPLNIKETRKALLNYLGTSSLFTGDYVVADRCFRELISCDPLERSNYHYLALAREKAGDIDGAIRICNDGLNRFPQDSYFMKRKFLLLVAQGAYKEALEIYEGLNGAGTDTAVVAGRFLIACKGLNVTDMDRFYRLLQEGLSMTIQSFPENLPEIRERLSKHEEPKGAVYFETAISFLLNNCA